jgi:Flp pilus assembly protein TadG
MALRRKHDDIDRPRRSRGQALLEFAAVLMLMLILAFGMIDFGRAIYQKQVMTNLTREGSNLASRNTTLADAAAAVVEGSAPLDINSDGRVILTAVENTTGVCRIVEQVSQGGIVAASGLGKKSNDPIACPSAGIPQPGQTAYVTEVFYRYQPLTPVGDLLKTVMPSTLYDVAYF